MYNSKKGMKMLIPVKWKKGCSSATTGSIIHPHFILTWDWESLRLFLISQLQEKVN